jgi:DNA-directed RNA polymerase subunit N (RpoN/RPB10)
MRKKSKQMKISEYMSLVADYIESEYGPDSDFQELTLDEKYTIKRMLMSHFELDNSINNAASDVISYIRDNREWMRENIK